MTTLKLNTGATIPALGFGTWQDQNTQEEAVAEALKAGFRHIDTAQIYGTEEPVGAAIKKSGIDRSKLFITTKLWNSFHAPEDVGRSLDDSLKKLGIDYVDLFLMHNPVAFKPGAGMMPKDESGKIQFADIDYVDTYKAMEKVQQLGKTRAIGISNYSRAQTERLLKEASTVPAVHQLELHPWLQQKSFVEWQQSKGIHITQYSAFGNSNPFYVSGQHLPKLIDEPTLVEIGKKYGKSGSQVALAWGINEGRSVLSKSKTPSRIRDNFEGEFKLDPEDLKKIDSMDKKLRFADIGQMLGVDMLSDLDGIKK